MLKTLFKTLRRLRDTLVIVPRLPFADLSERQQALLRARLADAATTPFHLWRWSQIGVRQPTTLEELPVLRKRELQAAPADDLLSDRGRASALLDEKSSGTSGNPFNVRFDPDYVLDRNLRFLRGLLATGYRWPMRMLLITGDRDRRSSPLRRWWHASLKTPVESWHALYRQVRPQVLYGCTTPLRLLAEHIEKNDPEAPRPRIVITTAETLDSTTRALLQRVFRAEVFDFYGLTEMGLVGWECRAHQGYHLAEDAILIERIPLNEGSNAFRLIYSNLQLAAMPLLRYDSGDIGHGYTHEPCPCGSQLPRIRHFEGRVVDAVRLPDGQLLSPYRFMATLENLPGLRRFRVLQTALDRLQIELECAPGSPKDKAVAEARQILSTLLPPSMEADIEVVPAILVDPTRKFRNVECRLPGDPLSTLSREPSS